MNQETYDFFSVWHVLLWGNMFWGCDFPSCLNLHLYVRYQDCLFDQWDCLSRQTHTNAGSLNSFSSVSWDSKVGGSGIGIILNYYLLKGEDWFYTEQTRKLSSPQKSSELKSPELGISRKKKEKIAVCIVALGHQQVSSTEWHLVDHCIIKMLFHNQVVPLASQVRIQPSLSQDTR